MDCHIHTKFSYDSSCEMEEVLLQNNHTLTFTDSLIFDNLIAEEDSILDDEKYSQEIFSLREKFPERKIYKGIEIGYTKGNRERIQNYLTDKSFDVKLLSIRSNGKLDFMSDEILFENVNTVVAEYFSLMKQAITEIDGINVLSSLDYGLRRFSLSKRAVILLVEHELEEIFKLMIQRNIALELNAKGCFFYGYRYLYDFAVTLYQELGGTLFTFGSEAKRATEVELNFSRLIENAKKAGIHHVVQFDKGKCVNFKI
ncbi:histidinol-phosphatase (PHP family) [Pilibacter termitis]|uniref:Histidinol-phosphatase n=1 Tax=Pilibacter termitis TaxID=263852 RepID=A0A1T4L331_9ENTE|nr:PHP domain-containing protein [Pilibacter termitis]SJZ49152.1 histidinol-phosphatase (PHP family) [Pilibacter termitis]